MTNFLIHEIYPYRVAEHFRIVDHAPELEVCNGHMPIPDGAGIGVDLVREWIRPFTWAQCSL
jgi:L-alanine-DL-glutamate epimerase-like enolase superfamily enzyme